MFASAKILTFPRSSVPMKGRLPKWSDLDAIWLDDLAEGLEEGLEKRERERCVALTITNDAGGGP